MHLCSWYIKLAFFRKTCFRRLTLAAKLFIKMKNMLKQELRQYPLSKAVRNGRCGTCPKTLTQFLDTCGQAGTKMSNEQCRQLHIDVLDILLDTICDTLIAKCWRGWCLDNTYKPLSYVRVLSTSPEQKRELAQIENQMRALSHYFLT